MLDWGSTIAIVNSDPAVTNTQVASSLRLVLGALVAAAGPREELGLIMRLPKTRSYLLGAAEVAAVRQSVGPDLQRMVVTGFSSRIKLSPLFWGAMLQLPSLRILALNDLKELDATAAAIAATAATRPLAVHIVRPCQAVERAVLDAVGMLRAQQVESLVTFVA